MVYANRDDLIARFGVQSIESLEKAISKVVDPAVSDEALSDAQVIADSYLAVHNALPLPSVPEVLKGYVLDIARYKLYTQKPTEEVRQRYDDAIKWLDRVSSGRAILLLPPSEDGIDPTKAADTNRARVAVGVSHFGGVFGREVTDMMPLGDIYGR